MDLQSQLQSALEFKRRGKTKKEVINSPPHSVYMQWRFYRLKDQVERRLRQADIGFGSESVPADSGRRLVRSDDSGFYRLRTVTAVHRLVPVRVVSGSPPMTCSRS